MYLNYYFSLLFSNLYNYVFFFGIDAEKPFGEVVNKHVCMYLNCKYLLIFRVGFLVLGFHLPILLQKFPGQSAIKEIFDVS